MANQTIKRNKNRKCIVIYISLLKWLWIF